jgi:hypothetical protein
VEVLRLVVARLASLGVHLRHRDASGSCLRVAASGTDPPVIPACAPRAAPRAVEATTSPAFIIPASP